MSLAEEREQAITRTVDRIRAIETEQGVSRNSLAAIRSELLALAARTELFPESEFPGPADGRGDRLFNLSEDDDGRFALYLNRGDADTDTPPHNHTTWAVVVGVRGKEINRFYARDDESSGAGKASLHKTGEVMVEPGRGVCLLPEDIHSVHMRGDDVKYHLHMYGLAINRLTERLMFDLEAGTCRVYEPHPDAR